MRPLCTGGGLGFRDRYRKSRMPRIPRQITFTLRMGAARGAAAFPIRTSPVWSKRGLLCPIRSGGPSSRWSERVAVPTCRGKIVPFVPFVPAGLGGWSRHPVAVCRTPAAFETDGTGRESIRMASLALVEPRPAGGYLQRRPRLPSFGPQAPETRWRRSPQVNDSTSTCGSRVPPLKRR